VSVDGTYTVYRRSFQPGLRSVTLERRFGDDPAHYLARSVVDLHDLRPSEEEIRDAKAEPVSFDELVEGSDVLSLNAPLTPETEARFDASVFDRMPEGSVLINTALGRLVDEAALVDALDDGPLGGARLDVLATEPPEPDNPLLHHPDTIVTPHAAWYSPGAVEQGSCRGSEIAAAAYRGEAVDGVVNPAALDAE
jgi:D-3-phosphoglycerate dehydrogenase